MSKRDFPVLIGESIETALTGRRVFPFRSWASANRFEYPPEAEQLLCGCGSAAEAWFVRPFAVGASFENNRARKNGVSLELQVRASVYYIDAVVKSEKVSIAIEIDGMQWHHKNKEQVANDYLRERRLVLVGHTVIRFTAPEIFKDVGECWRQVDAILERRGRA